MKNKIVFHGKRNSAEAKGEIWLRKSSYGYHLYIGGANLDEDGHEQVVASIDLFPQSIQGRKFADNHLVIGNIRIYEDEEPAVTAELRKNVVIVGG
jgi:hypothetical protein